MMAPLVVMAQQVVVSGVVVDDKTNAPLGQVSVSSGKVSVVTNEDGAFTLKLDVMPERVRISHLGYKTRLVSITQGQTDGLKVRLIPTTIQLQEIIVTNEDPRELVDIAISKIPENYSRVPELLKGFYRETAMKRKHYIYVAEGVEDMYKTPYTRGTSRDKVAIIKGRRLLSQKTSDTLGVKVMTAACAANLFCSFDFCNYLIYKIKIFLGKMSGCSLICNAAVFLNHFYAVHSGKNAGNFTLVIKPAEAPFCCRPASWI